MNLTLSLDPRIFECTLKLTISTTRIAPLLTGWRDYSLSPLPTEILKFLKNILRYRSYKTVRFLIRNSTSLDLGYRLSPALTASSHEEVHSWGRGIILNENPWFSSIKSLVPCRYLNQLFNRLIVDTFWRQKWRCGDISSIFVTKMKS